MKKKLLLFVAFTLLTFLMLTRVVRAQTARVAGAPIKGVIVRGNRDALVAGNPVPGVVIKGGIHATTITYENDVTFENASLSTYLGVSQLVIEKGEYKVDNSTGDARVILHLHQQQIVHRDVAARQGAFEGTDAAGNTFTYTIEPLYENGVAKDILVTYKGTVSAGIK
jgi:hypothetical protein